MAEPQASGSSQCPTNLTYIEKNGGKLLIRAGHQYVVKKKYKQTGLVIWECNQRRKLQCRGLLRILNDTIVDEKNHSCPPNVSRNERDQFVQKLKMNVVEPSFPAVPSTYNKAVASTATDASTESIVNIPNFSSVKSTVYRYRNSEAGVSKIVNSEAENVEIPPRYTPFLLADFNYQGLRIIIFCSEKSRDMMKIIKKYFSDGTFKSCPGPFEQLYVIHGDMGSTTETTNIMPLFYCLMNKMTTEAYVTLFNMIKSQIPEWEPIKYKTDYELAAIKAVKEVFPDTEITGCYYHYNKSIWKKARELELDNTAEKVLRREVELSAVLPLLPQDEITTGWEYITRKSTENLQAQKFRKYMKRQWLKSSVLPLLSVFGQRHRTNNFLEGWHNKLNKAMQTTKPNIMHFLQIIDEDAKYYYVRSVQAEQNVITHKRLPKSIYDDEFLQEAQLELLDSQITVGHFLEMVRH